MKYSKKTFLAILFLSLLSCQKEVKKKVIIDDKIIPVKIMSLQQKGFSSNIIVSGQFSTDNEVVLSFKTGGIVNSILVKEGDYVKKGQLLAKLDLTEINASVMQSRLALEKGRRDYSRVSKLYKDNVVTLEQIQNVKTALQIAQQQNNVAQFNLNHSLIKAIQDGYVLKKLANVGQTVSPGQGILQTNGVEDSKWILKSGISDLDWEKVSIGDLAKIKTDISGDTLFSSKVIRKSQGIDPSTGSFTIDIEVDSITSKKIASGMFGKAEIQTQKMSDTWVIPFESLLDANSNEGYVFVTNDNKTAKKLKVIIDHLDSNWVYINSGLENQKNLILDGNAYLTDNSKIIVIK